MSTRPRMLPMASSCASSLQHVELYVRSNPGYTTTPATLSSLLRCLSVQCLAVSRPTNPGLGLVPNYRGHGTRRSLLSPHSDPDLNLATVDPRGHPPALCCASTSVSTQEAPEKCHPGTVRLPLAQCRAPPHIFAGTSVQTCPRPVTDPPRHVRPLPTALKLLQGDLPVSLPGVCRRHLPQGRSPKG